MFKELYCCMYFYLWRYMCRILWNSMYWSLYDYCMYRNLWNSMYRWL